MFDYRTPNNLLGRRSYLPFGFYVLSICANYYWPFRCFEPGHLKLNHTPIFAYLAVFPSLTAQQERTSVRASRRIPSLFRLLRTAFSTTISTVFEDTSASVAPIDVIYALVK
jgi:hypothetical protein